MLWWACYYFFNDAQLTGIYTLSLHDALPILSKIAPTIAYQKVAWGDPWRRVITATAQAIDEPEKGKQLIADLEERISKAGETQPAIKGKTAAVMYFDASKLSKFSVYTTSDARPQFLNDPGMETTESIKEDSKGTKNFYKEISSDRKSVA